MSRLKHKLWPSLAAGMAAVAAVFAADALWHWDDPVPAGPVLAPEVAPRRPERPRLHLPMLPKPSPTPLSEKDDAIRKLRLLELDPNGPALAKAVRDGVNYTIDLFLKAGLSPDSTDADGQPVLVVACEAGRTEAAARLLEAGANPDASGPEGNTPLAAAAARGNLSLLRLLADKGATLEHADAEGHTALSAAVVARQAAAVQWLIERGAPLEAPCCDGSKTLLAHAVETGAFPILEAVLKPLKPAHWVRETREALYEAVRKRDKKVVRLLLENHGEPPSPEGFRQPLLGYAIAWGEPAVLQLLLECGADPNTPLDSPVEAAFSKLIPEKVTRYYLQNEEGVTPLMVAAGLGQLASVEALIKHGAKRGALTKKSKFAALSFAARAKNTEIMQVLLGKSPRPEDQRVRIEISLGSQTARLWKDNRIVLSVPISTGRSGYPTPSGQFVVTDKHRSRTSTIYKVKMPYFMRLNCSEVGMHAGAVPNYPASHGCIRLPASAAVKFYREADVGTLVTIR